MKMPLSMRFWISCVTLAMSVAALAADRPADPPQLVVQSGHFAVSGAFSPDGKTVVSGGYDYTLKLWDVASGRELRSFVGHQGSVSSVAFSPDGRTVASGGGMVIFSSKDHTIKLWDVATGRELRTLAGHGGAVNGLAFSPDGKTLVSAGEGGESGFFKSSDKDDTIKLWDVASGSELLTFSGHGDEAKSVAFSPDGKTVASGNGSVKDRQRKSNSVSLWDVATGKEIATLAGHDEDVVSVAFSPDGKRLVSGSNDKTIRLWDVATGKLLATLTGHAKKVTSVVFSADGKTVLSGSADQTLKLWDAAKGREIKTLTGHGYAIESATFSPDGKSALSAGMAFRNGVETPTDVLLLWDVASGKRVRSFAGYGSPVYRLGLSPDGRSLASTAIDGKLTLWDFSSGRELRTLVGDGQVVFSPDSKTLATGGKENHLLLLDVATGHQLHAIAGRAEGASDIAFSADGNLVAVGGTDHSVELSDVRSGRKQRSFAGNDKPVESIAFSPDGKRLASGADGGEIKLFDIATGKQKLNFSGHKNGVNSITFSPDGKRLISTGSREIKVWDVASGHNLRVMDSHRGQVHGAALSADGKIIASAGEDKTVRLWDAETGEPLHVLTGHSADVGSVAFTPDGKIVVSSSFDRTIKLWRVADGALLATLSSFTDGHWAVSDPEGRFDASNGGDNPHLHWVFENTPIDLAQLKDRYYDPGLLQKIMGFDQEALRTVPKFEDALLHKWPEVALSADAKNPLRLAIKLTDRGDGYGRVRVRVNGKEVAADAAAGKALSGKTATLAIDLDPDRLLPGDNRVDVVAWPAAGHIPSPAAQLVVAGAAARGPVRSAGDKATAAEAVTLHAVVMGVSQYAGSALRLAFSGKDAADFATALELGGARLFGADRVRIHRFSDYTPGETGTPPAESLPSRDNLRRAFEAIANEAKAGDILLVYLAGHGVMTPGAAGEAEYYYLAREAQSTDLADPAVRKLWGISSSELTDWIKAIKASKQVLVLDTCAAGGAIDKLVAKRQIPGAQVIALEQLKDRTGIHILAGAAADRVSYEATQFGQGLLTYALLTGMKGAALKDEIVDVQRLFQYTRDEVPRLARQIGGIQEPRLSSPQGESFAIGRMAEDMVDVLKLGKRFDDRLKQETYAAARGTLVYVDADDFPEAWQLSGRYRKEAGGVRVTAKLFQGDAEKAAFEVVLPADEAAQTETLLAATIKAMESKQ
ncbi:MAG: hypothetical protein H6Q35_2508 [Proteobacteria bacterium]|nr:hypothetical protein [Pseudomonadota bacterium]